MILSKRICRGKKKTEQKQMHFWRSYPDISGWCFFSFFVLEIHYNNYCVMVSNYAIYILFVLLETIENVIEPLIAREKREAFLYWMIKSVVWLLSILIKRMRLWQCHICSEGVPLPTYFSMDDELTCIKNKLTGEFESKIELSTYTLYERTSVIFNGGVDIDNSHACNV